MEFDRKPIAFVGWGNVGGARAVEQLRTVAIELGMAPIRPACGPASIWNRRDRSATNYAAR
jgi:NAD(P)H-dependent FMN reductase